MPDEPGDHALGRSRGGFGTKIHLVTDGTGLPLAVEVSPGQAHESRYVEPVLNAVRIGRRQRPRAVAGDKGYSYPTVRAWLRQHHIHPVIPERDDQREHRAHRPGRKPAFDREVYRRRNVVERAGGLLKEARAIATRFDKLATQYRATVMLGILALYLRLPLANTPQSVGCYDCFLVSSGGTDPVWECRAVPDGAPGYHTCVVNLDNTACTLTGPCEPILLDRESFDAAGSYAGSGHANSGVIAERSAVDSNRSDEFTTVGRSYERTCDDRIVTRRYDTATALQMRRSTARIAL